MIMEVDVRGGWREKQPTLLFSAAIFSSVQNDYCTDYCTEIHPRLRINPFLRENKDVLSTQITSHRRQTVNSE